MALVFDSQDFCEGIFNRSAFSDCTNRLDTAAFTKVCLADTCQCGTDESCVCKTASEFSRQCIHAGGVPGDWRTSFCRKAVSTQALHLSAVKIVGARILQS